MQLPGKPCAARRARRSQRFFWRSCASPLALIYASEGSFPMATWRRGVDQLAALTHLNSGFWPSQQVATPAHAALFCWSALDS